MEVRRGTLLFISKVGYVIVGSKKIQRKVWENQGVIMYVFPVYGAAVVLVSVACFYM